MGTKRKIQIEKLGSKQKIAVAFSKRRAGLCSKLSDLCALGGAKVALFVTAPTDSSKFYSFGNPSADEIADAFLENRLPSDKASEERQESILSDYQIMKDRKRKIQRADMERSKNKRKKLEQGFWWEQDDFETYDDIGDLKAVAEQLKALLNNVTVRLDTMNGFGPSIGFRGGDVGGNKDNLNHHANWPLTAVPILDRDDDESECFQDEKMLKDFLDEISRIIESPTSSDGGNGGCDPSAAHHDAFSLNVADERQQKADDTNAEICLEVCEGVDEGFKGVAEAPFLSDADASMSYSWAYGYDGIEAELLCHDDNVSISSSHLTQEDGEWTLDERWMEHYANLMARN